MKKIFVNTLALSAVAVSLAACGACPTTSDYGKVPYTHERTAGTGLAVYDGSCRRTETVRTTTVQHSEPVRSAEPVFQNTVRK